MACDVLNVLKISMQRPAIKSPPGQRDLTHRPACRHRINRIYQLHFTTMSGALIAQDIEHIRRQKIASNMRPS